MRLAKICGLAAAAAAMFLRPAAASAGCKLGKVAELSVTMDGMRPLVRTRIDGTEVMLLVDSGAFFSLLSDGAAAQLHLKTSYLPPEMALSGVGGNINVSLATVKSFELAEATYSDVEFLVGGSEMQGAAMGLLGQNVLRTTDVDYDLAGGAIRLMRPHGCEKADLAYWSSDGRDSVIDIPFTSPEAPHTLGVALINGVKMRVMFDTGASTSVLDRSAALRAGIRTDDPAVKPAGYSSGIGRHQVKTWIAPIKTFELGSEQVRDTQIQVSELGMNETDLLLGADFFLAHRVFVSNSQHKAYFTYNGGPVFKLEQDVVAKAAPAVAAKLDARTDADGPADAAGFSRRGAARAARRDYASAILDFTQAVTLDPKTPLYLGQRASAHLALHERTEARSDLDAALALKPADADLRQARATLELSSDDKAAAAADLDAAAAALPAGADARLTLATDYISADLFDRAVRELDLWISAHPEDNRRGDALNDRCWARGLGNRELDKGLADCNHALTLLPDKASALDSRGLIHLRRGEYDRALADYDAVLKLEPQQAWSLYARGLAKLKAGSVAQGQAELAAALALDAQVATRAKTIGLTP